ncbi:WhiB family transcriptional regulator [uncultured Nocardioides sp.]|uniref:WhiB family transcriptional regulator n=1 Tax=uncultured Nocardioides sp. TaxID=198441 RepID=UPI002637409F|nr:WhiB family transcriptional regulator [uncultured Nocardioides sp.]
MTLTATAPWDAATLTPCRDDLDLWFAEKPEVLAVAQALCGGCPLAEACLTGALERAEPWGVWGGRILVDGAVVAVKRGRGRPPRSAPTAPAAVRPAG